MFRSPPKGGWKKNIHITHEMENIFSLLIFFFFETREHTFFQGDLTCLCRIFGHFLVPASSQQPSAPHPSACACVLEQKTPPNQKKKKWTEKAATETWKHGHGQWRMSAVIMAALPRAEVCLKSSWRTVTHSLARSLAPRPGEILWHLEWRTSVQAPEFKMGRVFSPRSSDWLSSGNG